MALPTTEVLLPSSPEEAVAAFGDGSGVTVVGGGTIVLPEITYGRLRPGRTLLLARAGLDGIRREGGVVTIGSAVTVAALAEGAPEPLATAAHRVADYEIRAQATIGGNLCAPPRAESPRGDLQAPLVALGARVRSAGAGGERIEPVEDFLAAGASGRLVVEVELDEPKRGSYASLGRPHAHAYTVLSVACAEGAGGTRVAVAGAGPRAVRCPLVEQALAQGASLDASSQRVLDDVEGLLQDDALASAWYRRRVLPRLVEQALSDLAKGD